MNRQLADEQRKPAEVAATFLRDSGLADPPVVTPSTTARRILGYTAVHLKLTLSALALACLVAIPTALALARHKAIARGLLYITGLTLND